MNEPNLALINFLNKKSKKLSNEKRESISNVIKSINLCPIVLDLEDSKDLIGVNDYIIELLNEYFLPPVDKYIPKEGSVSRKIMQALHKNHPDGLSKQDILREIGYKPPPPNTLSQHKSFFGSWASIKTLISHGIVDKSNQRIPNYTLTERGLQLANELFGEKEQLAADNTNNNSKFSLIVSRSELECRISVNIVDMLKRTKLKWKEKEIPIGSIWFMKGDKVIDTMIQFASASLANDDSLKRKINGSPFNHHILVIPSKENATNAEMKIRLNLEYDIDAVFLESSALIASYIIELVKQLENSRIESLGTFESAVLKCNEQKYANTVGNVWKEQLKLLPGVGPNFAANIAAKYSTPHKLISIFDDKEEGVEKFSNNLSKRWGKRPRQNTINSLLKLFTNTSTNL